VEKRETLKELEDGGERPGITGGGPGLVLLFSREEPFLVPVPLKGTMVIGRELLAETVADQRLSRRHFKLSVNEQGVRIEDLGSSNGTFVDGTPCLQERAVEGPAILRAGRSLFWLVPDISVFAEGRVQRTADGIVGPQLARFFRMLELAARTGDTVLVLGESGTGKELAARRFHRASRRAAGPFVAVNCATIPEGIAERLLFGVRRGAFSGAVETAEGYLAAADKGTLFLDELAELDPLVQPKLLRVLESKEVTRVGDTAGRIIDLGVCAATLRDIPGRVAAGKFREDLYYRLGRPVLHLPSLRRRREEIPFFIVSALGAVSPRLLADPLFVEACLRRPWPGNIRELLSEVTRSGHAAREEGRELVERGDLGRAAGQPLEVVGARSTAGGHLRASGVSRAYPKGIRKVVSGAAERPFPTRDKVLEALRAAQGNVTRAAEALGLHRNQLRRWLAKNDLPAS